MLITPDLTGTALDGRYELQGLVGEGAFGRVYRGVDRRLERPVAVKVIKPWWAEDDAWVERFQREAQLLALLDDPGIVQVFDIGHAEEGPYYVAELVPGESLAERLRRGRMPIEETIAVATQLCRALAGAHAQRVVHCDVKPANVLLGSDGRVKVGDFGVARLAGGTSQALSATVAGTPRYMAPEQARGRPTTPATDVYSAGVVLYEMLAGAPPFVDGSPVELGLRHLQDRPPPLPAGVPPGLRAIVARALEKQPDRRYADGAGMAAALGALADGGSGDAGALDGLAGADASVTAGRSGARGDDAGGDRAPGGAIDAPRTRVLPRRPATAQPAPAPAQPAPATHATVPQAPHAGRVHRGGARRRGLILLSLLALVTAGLVIVVVGGPGHTTVPPLRGLPRGGVEARAARLHVRPAFSTRHAEAPVGIALAQSPAAGSRVTDDSTVRVVLSAGPPPVTVPAVVGSASASAESAIAAAGLRYSTATVAAPTSAPGVVTLQSPRSGTSAPRGSTVALSIAEQPRWRSLTTFSGVDDGGSVPFRIEGRRWRVSYSMSYLGTCLLLLVCLGPSAEATNMQSGAHFGGFELGEGSAQAQVFDSGPGLYRLSVSGGHDSARWTMTVQDYY